LKGNEGKGLPELGKELLENQLLQRISAKSRKKQENRFGPIKERILPFLNRIFFL